MSPILARLAARNAFRGVQQQQRSFSRLPVTTNSAAADWGRQVKRLGKQGAIYFPAIGAILGWPYLAASGLDGHM
ncbi:hypothetical protein B0T21DRAFT_382891 [Apiosordaria backusii]|uniref:Uncharacterized protein n=1 Tax=Apiosordaria backusii TaxID=314023 RepID=A0AA40EIU5_9PEZI|nr:hypothetical protein B0T21DRAFT_382891 [Apiosordaria backusii]